MNSYPAVRVSENGYVHLDPIANALRKSIKDYLDDPEVRDYISRYAMSIGEATHTVVYGFYVTESSLKENVWVYPQIAADFIVWCNDDVSRTIINQQIADALTAQEGAITEYLDNRAIAAEDDQTLSPTEKYILDVIWKSNDSIKVTSLCSKIRNKKYLETIGIRDLRKLLKSMSSRRLLSFLESSDRIY